MSVVNKMLQDLEARKSTPEMISADYVPPPSPKRNLWAIVLILLALALIVYVWFLGPQKTPKSLVPTSIVEVKAQGEQVNSQAQRPYIEKNTRIAKELSKDTNLASKPKESTIIAPDETTEKHTTIETMDDKIVAMVKTQAIVVADTKQPLLQTAQIPANILENIDKVQPTSESRFSISDSTEKNKVEGAKQSVINALSKGDNGLAIRRLEELLRVQPDNIEARKKLAAILFAEKRSKQAEHVLLQGISKHPQRSDLRLMMARLYMQKKDHLAAIKLLSEVEPNTTNKVEFLAYRAALLQQNAHYEPAMYDYINLLEADSSNSKWWLGLAITQDRLGQTSEALSAYRNAYNKEQLTPSVIKFVEQRMSQIEGAR